MTMEFHYYLIQPAYYCLFIIECHRHTHQKIHQKVGYFYHFPKNFLRPYGAAEDAPTEETIFKRTSPRNCAWPQRHHYAVSELSSTVNGNLPILSAHPLMKQDGVFNEAKKSLQTLGERLKAFNLHEDGTPSRADAFAILKTFIDDPKLHHLMEEAFTLGGALMTLSTNYLVARSYVRNPHVYAANISMPSGETRRFQQSSSLADLSSLMLAGKHGAAPGRGGRVDRNE